MGTQCSYVWVAQPERQISVTKSTIFHDLDVARTSWLYPSLAQRVLNSCFRHSAESLQLSGPYSTPPGLSANQQSALKLVGDGQI